MEINDFVNSITPFDSFIHAAKIKIFAWYLLRYKQQTVFTSKDIKECFDKTKIAPPSAIAPFLTSLHKSKILIKKKDGYILERSAVSDFDKKYFQRDITIQIDKMLSELPEKLSKKVEKEYLKEALKCFRHQAFRASIVMSWNLAYDHLCQTILKSHLSSFNIQLSKSFPKADVKMVNNRDDLMHLKESQVIQVCKSGKFINVNVCKILKEKLDKRNIAAHPSGTTISQLTAEEFIKDLIDNVVLKIG